MHSTLSKSLKQAVRWRLVPLNVCMAVVLPRITKPEIQPIDAQQMKTLLRAAQDTDLYALWELMATTGVRVGEALGLRWGHLDLDARTLRVNRTIYRGQSCLPKTDVSEMLGHSDVNITLSIYAHVLPDMQDGAAEAMDDALS